MKKALIAFVIFFLGFEGASFAQIPEGSSIGLRRGRHFVKRFQDIIRDHPSSFLIKAKTRQGDGLADYLRGTTATLQNAYLHVYFGINAENKKCLVITGTVLTQDQYGRPILTHDRDNVGGDSYVWTTTVNEPDCCLPFDHDIDYADVNNAPNCKIENCTEGRIDERTAHEYITRFQRDNGNISDPVHPVIFTIESFLINANDIRKYLKKDEDNGNKIEYLQFYLGYKRQATLENTTLLTVGVDANGHHVWDIDADGYVHLFDEVFPCPKCNVVNDDLIDFHHQDGTPMQRRFTSKGKTDHKK